MQYYILFNNQPVGPMSASQIFSYPVDSNTMISRDGSPWQPLYTYPELMQMLNNPQMRTQGAFSTYDYNGKSDKSKTAAGLLAIFLGGLGIQYFYLGKVGGGFLTILLTIVTCGAWEIITLIQGILMLCMSDDEFDQKYVFTDKTLPLF